jgi:CRP-like cAMP-binding protein
MGRARRYPQGAHVIRQGDHSDTVFIVFSGRVRVTVDTYDGREIVLSVLGPGDLLGEFEAIDPNGGPRTAANVALEPVECREITGGEFRGFLDAHPRVAFALLHLAHRRLRAADRRRIDSGSLDTAHRLARYLLEMVDDAGRPGPNGVAVDIPLTQDELASLIAASRDSVVRALTALKTGGLITTARRKITIVDLDGLRRFAGPT